MGKKVLKVLGFVCAAAVLGVVILLFYDDGTVDLGKGYIYSHDCKHITGPTGAIPPCVLGYAFDGKYIIAKQTLNGRLPDRIYYDSMDYDYPALTGEFYWIIDKDADTYYGPFSHEDFLMRCKAVGVKLTLPEI